MKALLAAIALVAFGQAAQAAETAIPPGTRPVALTEAQMDQVAAGGGQRTAGIDARLGDITASGANIGVGGMNPVDD